MRHLKKMMLLLTMLMLLGLLPAMQSFAAKERPANVKGLQAKVLSETSVQLSWQEAEYADFYIIYQVDAKSNERSVVKKTSQTTKKLTDLTPDTEYAYLVYAYNEDEDGRNESLKPSRTVTVKPRVLPAKVKGFKAKLLSETSVQLTWSKSDNADFYMVYQINEKTNERKLVKKTRQTTGKLTGLTPATKYTYLVYAYNEDKDGRNESLKPSAAVTVKPEVLTPGKVTNLKISDYGDRSILLNWNKVKNATGYYIYQYNKDTKKYVKTGETRKNSYNVEKLEGDADHTFRVRAYRTVKGVSALGEPSSSVKGTARDHRVHGRYYKATVKRDSTVREVNSKKSRKLKRGTKVTATARTGSRTITVILSDKTKVRIHGSRLSFGDLYTVSADYYSKAVKEAFVNKMGYSSPSRYLIWISQYTSTTNIFSGSKGKWKLLKSVQCVIGKGGKTPVGTFRLTGRQEWNYGGPVIYFTWNQVKMWGNAFHRRVDGHVKGPFSHGCVRLDDTTLYFIRNNCPTGTTVVSK